MNSFNHDRIFGAHKKVFKRVLGRYDFIFSKYPDIVRTSQLIVVTMCGIWKKWESSINGILQRELDGPTSIKMSLDKAFKPDDFVHLESFIESTKFTNPFYSIDAAMPTFLRQLPDTLPTDKVIGVTFPTATFIKLLWQELLLLWHLDFLEILTKHLAKKFTEKMSLLKGFHNLSQIEIPPHLVEILKKGEKFSPNIQQPIQVYKKQFHCFVWNYVIWAARVLCKSPISGSKSEKDLDSILDDLIKDTSNPFHDFWCSTKSNFNNFMAQIGTYSRLADENSADNVPDFTSHILQPGIVCTTADKNYGLVLLPVEILHQAEEKILKDFGAVVLHDQNEKQILDMLHFEDANFRKGTDFISKLLVCFPRITRSKQKMAFLRLNPKIHKLSPSDLSTKKLDSLTFRPVCDSKFFTTKPCAQALASLLISLKEKVFLLYPCMEEFYPLSGADVARKMRTKKFPTNDPFNLIVSCDLSDAYSNVTLEDLIVCSRFLSAVVNNNPVEQESIEKLANFTLNSNYIESGKRLYILKPVLQMGSCFSGDALDIVLMAGEIKLLVNPSLGEDALKTIPSYLAGVNDTPDFLDYERYRDDTKILVSGKSPQDIISSLTTFAKAACPQRIPISFEYSVFNLSFLSCCFFCNFAGRSFSTYPRLNFTRPSKVVHPSSNTWVPQLFSGYISTMVDYSRICSERSILECVQKLLQNELLTAGFSQDSIDLYTRKAKLAIASAIEKDRTKFVDAFDLSSDIDYATAPDVHKIDIPEDCYPPGAIFNHNSNVYDHARRLVSLSAKMIPSSINQPPPKKSFTLKDLLASKSKYKSQSEI